MTRLRPLLLAALLGCPPADEAADSGADTAPTDTAVEDSGEDTGRATDSWTDGTYTAWVSATDVDTLQRTYSLTSDHPLRDGLPASGTVTIVEEPGQMVLRSGRLVLDALFALAMQEVRDNSVSEISDGAFASPVPCVCFETGEKWTWVWTRDTGYAVEHALALVDPVRSRNSLQFKLSDRKASAGGGQPSIVQDTGSGGSWPVSTDRAVWALGAWETLKFLDGAERTAFRDQAYAAMVNTLEEDRVYVYDPGDGLYRGEQSFLDWREQSYPTWTAADTAHIAMSKSLSTNLAHLRMMQITAALATEKGESANATRYQGWADALAAAIDAELWLAGDGLYSAMKTTALDPAPLRKWDLLGESMAALWLADEGRAATMVAAYPHAPAGPPVLWPQQPLIPIYHNRGAWPFVTAYDLRAAKRAGNAAVFTHDATSLVRGAALNLSNMENFEFLTGANWAEDGPYSGPVVNSRRQLWSVAGFVAFVTRGLFGVEATQDGVRVSPFVPAALHRDLLGNSEQITLHQLPYRGGTVDIRVELPSPSGEGAYTVSSLTVDGVDQTGQVFAPGAGEHAVVAVLGAPSGQAGSVREVFDTGDFTELFAPQEPAIASLAESAGGLALSWTSPDSNVSFTVFRDGEAVASGLSATSWTDSTADPSLSHCYAVEAEFATGNTSHHSPAVCWWGASYERITTIAADAFTATGGSYSTNHGRGHYENWGEPGHELLVRYTPPATGEYLVQVVYGNGAGPVNTGVTAGHKRLTVSAGGNPVAEGSLVMPHLGTWEAWEDSNFVPVHMDAGLGEHTLRIHGAPNMSWLEHHARYNFAGGGTDTYGYVNIAEVKLLRLSE